ncbi:hypothetical protein AS156_05045 [Bradyrhizobium macuxiense]|uniref:Polysaccharide chain length determinant N-terminal domain-containing protein n=1 Tax=Bradyrhizobium macuxiense TaxID=1755647 RepID=A0A109JW52_9BRAD|nr:Wzz/FepE/Etk N-terminal domain-containing protein [Bradyrhizobium macuxiense]KWV55979.1 hypothetical protein AS156_05045 [Bradyrhizobium macuxiense]
MSFEIGAIDAPRDHYERVVYGTLRILWTHKWLVVCVLGVAYAALSAALLVLPPRYTGEAIIKVDFVRNETVAGERVQSTAAVDAAAVVDSTARIIRSRATASAVVSALRLDNDPAYTSLSRPMRELYKVGRAIGLPEATPRDLAVSRLMNQIAVTNDPRSYLITVAVTTSKPERAAQLANWVASEYLRGRMREQATEAYAVAEREVATLSSVYGPRHPNYLSGVAKLERLKTELDAARHGAIVTEPEAVVTRDMVRFAAGQTLLPAEAVMIPSGPNAALLFVLTTLAALAVGILLALLAEKRARPGSLSQTVAGPGRPALPRNR